MLEPVPVRRMTTSFPVTIALGLYLRLDIAWVLEARVNCKIQVVITGRRYRVPKPATLDDV